QTNAVHRDRTLRHHLSRQFARTMEPDRFPLAFRDAPIDLAHAIDMALNDVSAEPVAGAHRAFEIHTVARPQNAEVRLVQGLGTDLEAAGLCVALDHRETTTVNGDALTERQLRGKWYGDDQLAPRAGGGQRPNDAETFDEAGEHDYHSTND